VEEYVPTATASFDAIDSITTYHPSSTSGCGKYFQKTTYQTGVLPTVSIDLDNQLVAETPAHTSRLAQLTDEELLSMVPDDVLMAEPDVKQQQNEPADILNDIPIPPVAKKTRFDDPPPPGLDD
jgi:hypothetical protein